MPPHRIADWPQSSADSSCTANAERNLFLIRPAPSKRNRAKAGALDSEELFDYVNRSLGANLGGADGNQPVQEGILRFGRFEARHGTKVGGWRAVVTNALECHVDEGAVVGLQRDAEVEFDDTVR